VAAERIYVDHGLTGTNRQRPGLHQALAACRAGDTLVVTKLDHLARSLPDARAIADELTQREVKLNLGGSVHDPTDPVSRLLFNVPAMVAEFESDLIRMRTREGMKVAKAKGGLRRKQPKLSAQPKKRTSSSSTAPASTPSANSRNSSPSRGPRSTVRSHRAAKADPGRRFHALYDKVFRYRSPAGRESIGRCRFPRSATASCRAPEAGDRASVRGGLPGVLVGFRPKRVPRDALQVLIDETWRGKRWIVESDVADCFEAIPHSGLMAAVEERISDRQLLKLLRAMLRAGVMADGAVTRSNTGTPQGGVVSPVLCNVYLHRWTGAGRHAAQGLSCVSLMIWS